MREVLPTRRSSESLTFSHDGIGYTASFSRFENGELAEVFLTASKSGTAVSIVAQDLAVVASLALQHGCPISILRHALQRLTGGAAAGPLGKLLDLIEGEDR